MPNAPRPSGIRSRALGAALVSLGCSLGVGLTPALLAAPPAEKTIAADHIKLTANQQKDRAALQKTLELDRNAVAADQQKLAAFEKSLSAEQLKLEANQVKLKSLRAALEADQHKLEANQIKFDRLSGK